MKNTSIILTAFLFTIACNKKTPEIAQSEITNTQKEILSGVDYNRIINADSLDGSRIEKIDIGTVGISSGKLVATDPLVSPLANPLNVAIPKGKHHLVLYKAFSKDMGQRIALAQLKLSNEKAEKWVLIAEDIADLTSLKTSEFLGIGVDSGTAGLYDYDAAKELAAFDIKFLKAHPGANIYDDFFAAEFKKNAVDPDDPKDIGEWVNFKLPDSNHNITMFSSGYGDGLYQVYKGIDADGKLCSIVIDLQILLSPSE